MNRPVEHPDRDGAAAAVHATPLPSAPGPEDWRALARSAPWRWTTLDATITTHPSPADRAPAGLPSTVRLRGQRGAETAHVETLDGNVLQEGPRHAPADRWANRHNGRSVLFLVGASLTGDEERDLRAEHDRKELAELDHPPRRADGLIAERPGVFGPPDPPSWHNYSYVALLDPAELADGRYDADRDEGHQPGDDATPQDGDVVPGVRVWNVRAHEVGGRPVWTARVLPTRHYQPRCGCCALIMTAAVAREEWGAERAADLGWGAPEHPADPHPDPAYAEVSLDVASGVVARLRIVGGREDGSGYDVDIVRAD